MTQPLNLTWAVVSVWCLKWKKSLTAFLCEKDSEMFCLVTLHIGTFRPLSLEPLEHKVSTKPSSPLSASYSELTVISVSSSSPALRFSRTSPASSSLKMKSLSPPIPQISLGRIQKYLLCNLVDFSIKWWVGSFESIKLIEAILSIQFFQLLCLVKA